MLPWQLAELKQVKNNYNLSQVAILFTVLGNYNNPDMLLIWLHNNPDAHFWGSRKIFQQCIKACSGCPCGGSEWSQVAVCINGGQRVHSELISCVLNSLPHSLQIYSLPAAATVGFELLTCNWSTAALYTLLKWQPIRRWIWAADCVLPWLISHLDLQTRAETPRGWNATDEANEMSQMKKSSFETELKIQRLRVFSHSEVQQDLSWDLSARSKKCFWQTPCVFSQSQERFSSNLI